MEHGETDFFVDLEIPVHGSLASLRTHWSVEESVDQSSWGIVIQSSCPIAVSSLSMISLLSETPSVHQWHRHGPWKSYPHDGCVQTNQTQAMSRDLAFRPSARERCLYYCMIPFITDRTPRWLQDSSYGQGLVTDTSSIINLIIDQVA